VILLLSQNAPLGWLFLFQFWFLLFWFGRSSQGRGPFARRLDQLFVLLVPAPGRSGPRLISAHKQETIRAARKQEAIRALRRYRTLAGLRRSARRWRGPLRAVYTQGYQAASETIPSAGEGTYGPALLGEAVQALKTERLSRGDSVPSREDPVVVLAYGLGAWPPGADLTSLEQLLGQLGLTQVELRARFENLIRPLPTATQSRAFRELAGASFVLGASSRIVEAAAPRVRSAPSNRWFAAIKAHLR
jgi:hypothetical protein